MRPEMERAWSIRGVIKDFPSDGPSAPGLKKTSTYYICVKNKRCSEGKAGMLP